MERVLEGICHHMLDRRRHGLVWNWEARLEGITHYKDSVSTASINVLASLRRLQDVVLGRNVVIDLVAIGGNQNPS